MNQLEISQLFIKITEWAFGLNTSQVWWYITRSSALVAYLLLWLSTAWGLAVASKVWDGALERVHTYEFHQLFSLLALGFMGLHAIALTFDHYMPFTWLQILIPFTAPTGPFWVGVGVIAFYLSLLVTVTFYMRKRISMGTFRKIHYFSLVAFFGAALHGLFSGTDSALPVVRFMYLVTFLSTAFLLTYWLARLALGKQEKKVLA
jgi:hypothetical protein